jgi:hypothetical protein
MVKQVYFICIQYIVTNILDNIMFALHPIPVALEVHTSVNYHEKHHLAQKKSIPTCTQQ